MATFSEIRVARKLHQAYTRTGGCDCCRRDIKPGEVYSRGSATPQDGEVNQTDRWAHMKAHHPYGSCISGRGVVS